MFFNIVKIKLSFSMEMPHDALLDMLHEKELLQNYEKIYNI
jgi:hypothetical protein